MCQGLFGTLESMREIIHKHIGVRAEGMILAGFLWIILGAGFLSGAQSQTPEVVASLWHTYIPFPISAVLWMATGIFAIIVAPTEKMSSIGLGLLLISPMVRFTSYISSFIIELIPGPPPGDPRGLYTACIYGAMMAFVVLLSHIPATTRVPLGRRVGE